MTSGLSGSFSDDFEDLFDTQSPDDDLGLAGPSSLEEDSRQPSRGEGYDIHWSYEPLRCSKCGAADGSAAAAFAACHHCGRILCLKSCAIRIAGDLSFWRGWMKVTEAFGWHCEDCGRTHHRIRFQLSGAAARRP